MSISVKNEREIYKKHNIIITRYIKKFNYIKIFLLPPFSLYFNLYWNSEPQDQTIFSGFVSPSRIFQMSNPRHVQSNVIFPGYKWERAFSAFFAISAGKWSIEVAEFSWWKFQGEILYNCTFLALRSGKISMESLLPLV